MNDRRSASASFGQVSSLGQAWNRGPENGISSVDMPEASFVELPSGTILSERYEVRQPIGRGGMGIVYAAFDRQRNQEIAIKIMSAALFSNPQAQAQFRREAQITSDLNHPNIVNVYDLHVDGNLAFLTMELLRGKTLRQELRERNTAGKPFAVDEAKRLILQLCGALEYAHHFTVHRDVKPENIWITSDGHLKLMDFGLAGLLLDQQRSRTCATTSGLSMGTPYYMAPEQLKDGRAVDARADQYSAAALFYELLTGAVVAGMIGSVRDARKEVPHGLSRVIHRALAVSPEHRYPTMAAFSSAIRAGGDPLPWQPRTRAQLTGALVLIAAICFGLFSLIERAATSWRDIRSRRQAMHEETTTLSRRIRAQRESLDRLFAEFLQHARGVDTSMLGSLDPLDLLQVDQKLHRANELLGLGRNSLALRFVLDARDLADRADRELMSWHSSRDDDKEAQKLIDFLHSLSPDDRGVSQNEIDAWTAELERSRLELRSGNISESVTSVSNLNVRLTGALRTLATTLREKAETSRRRWQSFYEANAFVVFSETRRGSDYWKALFRSNSVPTIEFLQPNHSIADPDLAFRDGDYVTAATSSLTLAAACSGWVDDAEALHRRTDQFLAQLGRPLEIRTNSLGMRFVRAFDDVWVSIWETRMMDYAVFLQLAAEEHCTPDTDWWKYLAFVPSATQPVTGVSEPDCMQFTAWLRNMEHKTGALPKDEHYVLIDDRMFEEIARRLSPISASRDSLEQSRAVYHYGERWPPNKGSHPTWGDPGRRIESYLLPAATFRPNALGIFDFEGNVWERMDGPYDFGADHHSHYARYFRQFCGGGPFGVMSAPGVLKAREGYLWVGVPEAIGFRIVLTKANHPEIRP